MEGATGSTLEKVKWMQLILHQGILAIPLEYVYVGNLNRWKKESLADSRGRKQVECETKDGQEGKLNTELKGTRPDIGHSGFLRE